MTDAPSPRCSSGRDDLRRKERVSMAREICLHKGENPNGINRMGEDAWEKYEPLAGACIREAERLFALRPSPTPQIAGGVREALEIARTWGTPDYPRACVNCGKVAPANVSRGAYLCKDDHPDQDMYACTIDMTYDEAMDEIRSLGGRVADRVREVETLEAKLAAISPQAQAGETLDATEQGFLEDNIATVAFHLGRSGATMNVNHQSGGLYVSEGEVLKEVSRRLSVAQRPPEITSASDFVRRLRQFNSAHLAYELSHDEAVDALLLLFGHTHLVPSPPAALPAIVDRDELIALLQDLASVNLSREAVERQARRMADDLIARGLSLPSTDREGT